MRIFLLFLVFIFSKSYGAGIIDHDQTKRTIYEGAEVVIKKVAQSEETLLMLRSFEETNRLECYQDDLSYPLGSPFGVYIAFDCKSNAPVAARSIAPSHKSGHLTASGVLDVLTAFKGKGYGSLLLCEVTKHISQFLGSRLEYNKEEPILMDTFSFLCGDVEWEWGKNYPSLSTALKSGYGIVCIAGSNTVQMLYSKDPTIAAALWQEERLTKLKNFARFMMSPRSPHASSDSIVDDITYILTDLNLTQEADIVTLLNTSVKVLKVLNKHEMLRNYDDITSEETDVYQKIYDGTLCALFENMNSTNFQQIKEFAEGQRLSNLQNLQIDWFSHCRDIYAFPLVLKHFKTSTT